MMLLSGMSAEDYRKGENLNERIREKYKQLKNKSFSPSDSLKIKKFISAPHFAICKEDAIRRTCNTVRAPGRSGEPSEVPREASLLQLLSIALDRVKFKSGKNVRSTTE